jgi:hypothetical protein
MSRTTSTIPPWQFVLFTTYRKDGRPVIPKPFPLQKAKPLGRWRPEGLQRPQNLVRPTLKTLDMKPWEREQFDALQVRRIIVELPDSLTYEEKASYCHRHPDTVRKRSKQCGRSRYRTDRYVRRSIRPAA